jgi:C-terminal processing protease CtpA/Prc
MNTNFCKAALLASAALLLLPNLGWAAQVTSASPSSYVTDLNTNPYDHSVFGVDAAVVRAKEAVKPSTMPRSPPAKSLPAKVDATSKAAVSCEDLYAKHDSVSGFNSPLEYTCAYERFRDLSIVLIDKDKMAKFVDAWAPEKWLNSDLLKMDGVSDAERTLRTFVLISRMRDFTHERFDFAESPKQVADSNKTFKAPVLEGGAIGARLKLNREWELKKAIFDGAPKEGLSQDAFVAKRKALFVVGPGHELIVDAPIPDGPADGVLKDGDLISAVDVPRLDGQPADLVKLEGMPEEDAINLIKGPLGTSVTLHVLRQNAKGVMVPLTFSLVRSTVRGSAVVVHDVAGIRYIELENFTNDDLLSDFYQALKGAQDKSMKGVAISVRGNPGGRVDYVLAMLDMIIPHGLVLRSTERVGGTDQMKETEYVAQDGFGLVTEKVSGEPDSSKKIQAVARVPFSAQYAAQALKNPQFVYTHPLLPVIDGHMPVAVIVNVDSYSASEIFAGAIQGTERGPIVGQPSAGKGAIMADGPLPEGGSVAVTFGEFFPGGIKNKGPGILPDYEVQNPEDFGQTDAQREKAEALIEEAHKALEHRIAEGVERTKINGARFEEDMKRRDEFDMKDPQEQKKLMDQTDK